LRFPDIERMPEPWATGVIHLFENPVKLGKVFADPDHYQLSNQDTLAEWPKAVNVCRAMRTRRILK
jgi:hypothetical protein